MTERIGVYPGTFDPITLDADGKPTGTTSFDAG